MAKTSDIAEMQMRHSDTPCALLTVDVEMGDQVLTITDDLPHDAAISASELDAIERYMNDILDVVLGSGQAK
jgi:hypothetical protein